ncbi:hypothetical protein FMK75_21400 [Klebsiella oxytoca]|uniref:hypothetical protein n=1 Tax=Klebsiella oxytoca TaxID=571 RepID=UPI001CC92CD5|nr:hypothetical protein [Klebsiella oxytoca]MBZ7280739.1 hypothetical protein [Klebsiella oxytoca]
MTTNITILVQRLKVAAKNGCCHTLFPDDCLALVEALEKAQRRIVELDRKNCELDSLTQRWAVELAENADHIAELESRTVTVKLPDLRQVVSGDRYVWSDGVFNYSQDVKAELTAKGIKWEAE